MLCGLPCEGKMGKKPREKKRKAQKQELRGKTETGRLKSSVVTKSPKKKKGAKV